MIEIQIRDRSADISGTLRAHAEEKLGRALAPFGNLLTMRTLEFDEARRRLLIDADLADPSAAPSIVETLRKAGLTARFQGTQLTVGAGGEA